MHRLRHTALTVLRLVLPSSLLKLAAKHPLRNLMAMSTPTHPHTLTAPSARCDHHAVTHTIRRGKATSWRISASLQAIAILYTKLHRPGHDRHVLLPHNPSHPLMPGQSAGYHQLFKEAVQRLEGLGGRKTTLDMSSFLAAAKLLYESALLAERVSGLRAFLEQGRVR